jgi:hypothetical protein
VPPEGALASRVSLTFAVPRLGALCRLVVVMDLFIVLPLNAAPMQGAQQDIATAKVRLHTAQQGGRASNWQQTIHQSFGWWRSPVA